MLKLLDELHQYFGLVWASLDDLSDLVPHQFLPLFDLVRDSFLLDFLFTFALQLGLLPHNVNGCFWF